MNTPYERTKAVIETRELLHERAQFDGPDAPVVIHNLARQHPRHVPLDVDIEVSAAALPGT